MNQMVVLGKVFKILEPGKSGVFAERKVQILDFSPLISFSRWIVAFRSYLLCVYLQVFESVGFVYNFSMATHKHDNLY